MTPPAARTVETTTHGRFLVSSPDSRPAGLLVGFHGYAENAEIHLEALRSIPGAERWLLVAVQALHPFYARDQRIVANWMTSQDRELALTDNIAYVHRVLDLVRGDHPVTTPLVFVGFSQGGAMAYRAAASVPADGLIILAADVPPDVAGQPALRLPTVLIGRGRADQWYTAEKHHADLATLDHLGVQVENCLFEGGHEWGDDFRAAVARYLTRVHTSA